MHHPVAASLYYEDQTREAKRAAAAFTAERIPKFLSYFDRAIAQNGGTHACGRSFTYADTCIFQLVEGLFYAFPRATARATRRLTRVLALRDAVAARPRLAAYLASPRRLPFNEQGIFRHYPELDVARRARG